MERKQNPGWEISIKNNKKWVVVPPRASRTAWVLLVKDLQDSEEWTPKNIHLSKFSHSCLTGSKCTYNFIDTIFKPIKSFLMSLRRHLHLLCFSTHLFSCCFFHPNLSVFFVIYCLFTVSLIINRAVIAVRQLLHIYHQILEMSSMQSWSHIFWLIQSL